MRSLSISENEQDMCSMFDFNEDELRNRFFENVRHHTSRSEPMDEEAKIYTAM